MSSASCEKTHIVKFSFSTIIAKVLLIRIGIYMNLFPLTNVEQLQTILTTLILGCLASFSPCNLPLAPILWRELCQKNTTTPAIAFIIGIILANFTVGLAIIYFKASFTVFFQSEIIRIAFACLLLYTLAIMLGLLRPISFARQVAKIEFNRAQKSSIRNLCCSGLFGCLSAFVLSPCSTAPFVAAINLSLQISTYSAVYTMLFFGIGSATSFILLALGQTLIKPGRWLQWLELFNAALIFAIAVDLISRDLNYGKIIVIFTTIIFITFLVFQQKNQNPVA